MMTTAEKRVLVLCPNAAIDIFAWVEGFTQGVPNRILKETRYPGGKGLHVGMALSELGIPVTIAGFWGGEAGIWIKKACNEYYPKIEFIGPDISEWSRSCYTFKSRGDFDDTEILGPGPVVTDSDFRHLMDSIETMLSNTALIALCGSWPKGSPENGYQQVIELAKKASVRSFLDCTGPQLANALKAQPYGLHLNRKEITEYFQVEFDTAKKQIMEYCDLAAITDGSKGLYLISENEMHHALAKIEEVISTIGAGDCLLAGIIAGVLQNLPHQSIANLGAACGAANCMRADLGMLHKEDVERLLAVMAEQN
ncbi:1-phosphofructokinase family hexose kinase [Marinoscillum sp. 108]|uniref:1-phosphofructokinase family hexose kinase n=1 Tax=Marinoscillum sp. 108 TaxID=2653151 RepID=UPI00135BE360|nr:PfkB family carbohydrate kinase [Marinoscillum sp. 108]